MKRILFLMTIMFCVGIVSAQDIISLSDGTLIENVTIVSISDEGITYTKEGDTLTIPRNATKAILYANGRYEEIKNEDDIMVTSASLYQNDIESYYDDKGLLLICNSKYPKNCRKLGMSILNSVYKKVLKEELDAGASKKDAKTKARYQSLQESYEAVLQCAGESER